MRRFSVPFLVITQTSTLDPEPKSLKTPERMARATMSMASWRYWLATEPYEKLTVMFSLYDDSKTAMAASEPEPMVT